MRVEGRALLFPVTMEGPVTLLVMHGELSRCIWVFRDTVTIKELRTIAAQLQAESLERCQHLSVGDNGVKRYHTLTVVYRHAEVESFKDYCERMEAYFQRRFGEQFLHSVADGSLWVLPCTDPVLTGKKYTLVA